MMLLLLPHLFISPLSYSLTAPFSSSSTWTSILLRLHRLSWQWVRQEPEVNSIRPPLKFSPLRLSLILKWVSDLLLHVPFAAVYCKALRFGAVRCGTLFVVDLILPSFQVGGSGAHSSLSAPLGFSGNSHSQHHHPTNAVSTAGSFKAPVHTRQNKGARKLRLWSNEPKISCVPSWIVFKWKH